MKRSQSLHNLKIGDTLVINSRKYVIAAAPYGVSALDRNGHVIDEDVTLTLKFKREEN